MRIWAQGYTFDSATDLADLSEVTLLELDIDCPRGLSVAIMPEGPRLSCREPRPEDLHAAALVRQLLERRRVRTWQPFATPARAWATFCFTLLGLPLLAGVVMANYPYTAVVVLLCLLGLATIVLPMMPLADPVVLQREKVLAHPLVEWWIPVLGFPITVVVAVVTVTTKLSGWIRQP